MKIDNDSELSTVITHIKADLAYTQSLDLRVSRQTPSHNN